MIRLAKPYIPDEAFTLLKDVFDSGNLVQGKYVQQFEDLTAAYLKIPYVKMVSSGTAALHLALMALDIRPGDEIIIPAFSFPATGNVVEVIGATPVLVDIRLNDFCINVSRIEEKITQRTRAIMPVHEFGQVSEMTPIKKLAEKYNLYIIEDAACALGSEYNGQKAGTFGDIGCFSLHPRKAITTGEGGVVVTCNEVLAERIDQLRNHGSKKVNGVLDFFHAGLNYRMTELQAVLGILQMKVIEEIIDKRIKQAGIYSGLLSGCDEIVLPEQFSDRKNIYQTFHILIKSKNRDSIIKQMFQNGIETNYGAQALQCLTFYRNKYCFHPGDYPNAKTAYNNGLALPVGMHLSKGDLTVVADTLLKIIN